MTRQQFIATHGPAAAKIAESTEFGALLDTAREECPYVGREIADPTGIVRNEGRLQGWNEALKFLKTAHLPPHTPSRDSGPRPQYEDPSKLLNNKK